MGKWINYKGQQFGRLTVISDRIRKNNQTYYLCRCECGNTKEIRIDHLKNGTTKSCGCLQKERASENFKQNLIGERFERLVVLEEDIHTKSHRGVYWFCKCDCGKITSVCAADLKSGHTKSCGCLQDEVKHNRFIDLTGKTFNYLQVVSLDEERTRETKNTYWYCKCLRCNNEKVKSVKGSHLKDGSIKSCGCLKSSYEEQIEKILLENNIEFKREYTFNNLYGNKRKLPFDFAIFKENELKYLIEYHGEQHYQPIDYWGGEESFQKRQLYDKIKQEYCINNNILLIILNKNTKINKQTVIKEEFLIE